MHGFGLDSSWEAGAINAQQSSIAYRTSDSGNEQDKASKETNDPQIERRQAEDRAQEKEEQTSKMKL